MLWLRACPRCGGDLLSEQGPGPETWVSCLQCGKIMTAAEEAALRARKPAATKRTSAA